MNRPERKPNRLKDYDYSRNGFYFVTICVKNGGECFGEIRNGVMELNELGCVAARCWADIPAHFPDASLDEFVVMPNHIHGIVVIENKNPVGNKHFCSLPWQTKLSRSLSSIIRGFKIGVKNWCYENNKNDFQWQKSFHDHIIRDEKSLNAIRRYIRNNPAKWEEDRNHSDNIHS